MADDSPDWLARAAQLRKCECQVLKSPLTRGSIQRQLNAAYPGSGLRLRAADKPGYWFLYREEWPGLRLAKRTRGRPKAETEA